MRRSSGSGSVSPHLGWAREQSFTSIFVQSLLEEGVDSGELLRGTGLGINDLGRSSPERPFPEFQAIARNALRITGDPALGLWFGRRLKITSMGLLGYAALSSATLLESVMLLGRYLPLRTPHVRASLEFVRSDDETADAPLVPTLRFDENVPLEDLTVFLMEATIRLIADVATMFVQGSVPGMRFDLVYPEPPHWRDVEFEYPVRFSRSAHRAYADMRVVSAPMLTSDPESYRAAMPVLEQQLHEHQSERSAAERVLEMLQRPLWAEVGELPDAEQMAVSLGCSAQSLRRLLANEGTSYREIMDGFRRDSAIEALVDTTLSVESIARRLGYHDTANFRRAFRRWTGQSPNAYRTENAESAGTAEAAGASEGPAEVPLEDSNGPSSR